MSTRALAGIGILAITAAVVIFPAVLDARAEADGGPCVLCHEDCPEGEHVAADGGYTLPLNWKRNGGAHGGYACMSGSCATKHGPEGCGGGMLQKSDVANLERALLAGADAEVDRLLKHFPDNIELNGTRSAVQVRDCTGGLIAHLPAGLDIVASLSE